MTRRQALLALSTATSRLPAARAAEASTVWVGTYTRNDSRGIYAIPFDRATGQLGLPKLAAEVANPSFLALDPNGRFLYAVGELSEFQGQSGGALYAFSIDRAARRLKLLNMVPSGGSGPCHLVVDASGRNVLAVHYGSGSTVVFQCKPDGSLGERTGLAQHEGSSVNAQRQSGPHAHSVNLSRNNRWAVVADLGTDEYIVYAFDAARGTIRRSSVAKVAPGAGPRHFCFHPSSRYAYGINELSSSVTAFVWDEVRGRLKEVATVSTLPPDFSGENTCAEILAHPNGRFVYASNRGHNSIAVFRVDRATGRLTLVEQTPTQGEIPRNFRIDPSGSWLLAANQNSASIVVFAINATSGKLRPTGSSARVAFPVCLKFQ